MNGRLFYFTQVTIFNVRFHNLTVTLDDVQLVTKFETEICNFTCYLS